MGRRSLHAVIAAVVIAMAVAHVPAPVIARRATAEDLFERTSENPITGWTGVNSGIKIINNSDATPINFTGGSLQTVHWPTATNDFVDDQWSRVKSAPGSATGGYAQLACVRMTGAGATFDAYCVKFGDGSAAILIINIDNGTVTQEQNTGVDTVDGDTVCIQASGSASVTLKAFKNGVQAGTNETAQVDFTGGQPGFGGDFVDYDNAEEWHGGDGTCPAAGGAVSPKLLLFGCCDDDADTDPLATVLGWLRHAGRPPEDPDDQQQRHRPVRDDERADQANDRQGVGNRPLTPGERGEGNRGPLRHRILHNRGERPSGPMPGAGV